jgi:HEPN domain-containing protein
MRSNGMKKEVKNWLDSAEYDLETAEQMFKTGRYIYTIFMCQLALEKMFKAKVEEVTDKTPPKTHDLEYLLGIAELSPDEEMERFIVEISNLSVVTRYPSDFQRMLKDFSRKRTELIINKTKEVFQWIKKSLAS